MQDDLSLSEVQREWHGSMSAYLIGFFACILLTAASFSLVAFRLLPRIPLIYTLIGLAIVQATVQVLFFLHVGKEDKPKWETLVFLFMVLVVFIVVLGSLWIMYDLDNRVMSGMGM